MAIAGATACVAGTMMGGRISSGGGVGGGVFQRPPWLGSVDGYPTETYSNPAQFDHSVAGKKEGVDFSNLSSHSKIGRDVGGVDGRRRGR